MAVAWLGRSLVVGAVAVPWIWLCQPASHAREEAENVLDSGAQHGATNAASASRCDSTRVHKTGTQLASWLERLEAQRSDEARCATLNQLAARAELGDAVLDVLEQYTRAQHPFRLRECAVEALGFIDNPNAVASLLELSTTIDGSLQESLMRALATRDEPAAHARLITWVRDPSSNLRVEAAIALADVGAGDAVALIVQLLGEPDSSFAPLIAALGRTHDPRALRVLERLLSGTSDEKKVYAICTALGELGSAQATKILLALDATKRPFVYWVLARSADPSAQRALLAAADSGSEHARDALHELDSPEAKAWMLRALDSSDRSRVSSAMRYFSERSDQVAVKALSKLAQGAEAENARKALQALARTAGPEARDALEKLAGSPGPMQALALRAFAQHPEGTERARALALTLVDQDDPPKSALNILAADASPEAHEALLRAARGGAQTTQKRAIWLLAQRDDPESVQALSAIARTKDAPNQLAALAALAQTGTPAATQVLRESLHAEDPSVRAQAVAGFARSESPEVEQAMLTASTDRDSAVAVAAIAQLGDLATPAAVERLAQLATGKRGEVAEQALHQLAQAEPERATSVVDALMQGGSKDMQTALETVSLLPTEAQQRVLERGLGANETNVVSAALSQMQDADIDPSTFTEQLEQLAHDVQLPSELRGRALELLIGPSGE